MPGAAPTLGPHRGQQAVGHRGAARARGQQDAVHFCQLQRPHLGRDGRQVDNAQLQLRRIKQ